ncbi:undecaprenyl-phosphate 4-deoxy-4-formamido-L-arabinose transferase [Geobacter sp. OR-1]|uniref:glycosyltransferase family 2 protein n=1 Tax=Geobacter sp. OR-1 TaxID=1266765 RepID=UPI00054355C9|nr:glycosyltransferase family 2 protein [Geobacter sp. OR-1]GAM09069.1 undecaprenyl-phosphate 4-deoxy-4-formamido-L-arabinose transferase [Geobacter sp. OR-1]
MTRLSIVIPVFNAEKTIESLCNTLIALYSARFDLEIVLINDYSRDSTDLICRRLQMQHSETIVYLRLSRNFGEHNAVMAGLNSVTGDYCVIMDDDFQNPPEEVGKLVEEISKGYDVVYSRYPVKNDHLFRNIGSRVNDKMANLVLRKPADLYLSSFKVINRFLVDEIIKYTGPDPYIDAIILRSTFSIGSIEVRHDVRKQGRSGYTFMKLVSLWGNMVVSYSMIPLRLLGLFGFIMTLVGIYFGANTLVDYIFPGIDDPTEYETLMSVTAFFRGFQLLAISVVGEYVGRVYLSLNSDPQFIIREKFSARRKNQVVSIYRGADGAANESISCAAKQD